MIERLAKHFVPQDLPLNHPVVRQKYGTLCSVLGIVLNLVLFVGKLFAGLLSGSIAVMADAFNNLSDGGSSLVTLLGFRLAGQKPDRGHPFGHGRIEYLSGLAVSALILLMGVELAKSSIAKIRQPEAVEFHPAVAAILLLSVATKLYMSRYNRRIGEKIDSAAMKATATDSLSDSVATAVVLVATVAGQFTDFNIDGWCGAAVSCFILMAGYRAMRETIDPLLGQPPTAEFVQSIEEIVMQDSIVRGIHDLVVHNYGPGRVMISLHAEVPADGNLLELHDVIDNIEKRLRDTLQCEAVIHMDPVVCDDGKTSQLCTQVQNLVHLVDEEIQIHDFRMVEGPSHTNLIFDAVIPFGFRLTDSEVEKKIQEAIATLDGNYYAVVEVEHSYI